MLVVEDAFVDKGLLRLYNADPGPRKDKVLVQKAKKVIKKMEPSSQLSVPANGGNSGSEPPNVQLHMLAQEDNNVDKVKANGSTSQEQLAVRERPTRKRAGLGSSSVRNVATVKAKKDNGGANSTP